MLLLILWTQTNLAMQQDVKTLTLSPQSCASVVQAITKRHRTTTIYLLTYNGGDELCPALRLSTCSCVFSQAALKTVSASLLQETRRTTKAKQKWLQQAPQTPNLSSALNAGRSTTELRTLSCSTLLKRRKTPCVKQRTPS